MLYFDFSYKPPDDNEGDALESLFTLWMMQWTFREFLMPRRLQETDLGFEDRCFQSIVLNYSVSLLRFLTLMGLVEIGKKPHFKIGGNFFFLTQKS